MINRVSIRPNQLKKFLFALLILTIGITATAQTKVDSLLSLCEHATEKQKTGYYLELSRNARNDSATSNLYSRKAYALALKNNQIPEQGKAFYYMGETNFYARDYVRSIPFYEKAIPLYAQLNDSLSLTNCYSSIGLCHYYLLQGEKAITQYFKALKYAEHNKEYTAEIYANIALAHQKMKNYVNSIEFYRKALKINLSVKDSTSTAVDYNGIGAIYVNMAKYDSALVNFRIAYRLFTKIKNAGYQAISLFNIASIYPNYPDSLDKAIYYSNQSWLKFKELGWNDYEATIENGLAVIYLQQKKYKEAIEAFNRSLQLADQYKLGLEMKEPNYSGLSQVYEKMGNYKDALKYHILYQQSSDSLEEKEKYEQLINMEKQYETEKSENEIIRLQAKQKLTEIQLHNNKLLKVLGFITASLLLMLAFFMHIKYIEKKRSNKLLEEKNQTIAQSEHTLRLLNAAQNKFFSIIAHDIKNPFHTVLGYSYLLHNDYDRFTDEERQKFAGDIHHSTNNIFRLLQNLLDWSRSRTGTLTVSPTNTELNQLIKNALGILNSLAEQKKIQITHDYSEELKIYADPLMVEVILRNLINNAIKFTPQNGKIKITAQQVQNEVKICITDNGVGISDEDVQNLFRIESKVKRRGTNNEDGSGLGLILCKEFVDKNKGVIWAESTPGKGSCFFVTLPSNN